MSYRDDALKIINAFDVAANAAEEILRLGNRRLTLYLVTIAVEWLKSKERREKRRNIKAEIRPQFVPGKTTGSVRLSKGTVKRLAEAGKRWLDEYIIGTLSLGDWSKEELLAQAANERKSAHGSLRNYKFYTALADPMKDGQLVRDYWQSDAMQSLYQRVLKETETRTPELV
jgi:hypothetical protein